MAEKTLNLTLIHPCHRTGGAQGHKVKNPATQLAQRLRQIPVAMPLIISGARVPASPRPAAWAHVFAGGLLRAY
jgi:hypothetical protein